ncbi:amino acid adenylation domain-containing protein [Litoribaculum gwangyangense]|uniref:Amino acid adenylation domain-containing protein n=1 Tax=Litoribaculum gwangyangense TaxID=1130722 RepID=A0ABP9CVV2_9FLAO
MISQSLINGKTITYPKSTLHELFEKCSQINPNTTALEHEDEKISYGELNSRINQAANYLWDLGVRPGQIVAISLDRKPELIISIFAVLQCGAIYLPIDSSYPIKRLELIIEDSNSNFLISNKSRGILTEKTKNIFIENILTQSKKYDSKSLDLKISSEAGAYIIYTSGSTGKPKGVQVSHQNTINLIYSMAQEPGINANDKIFAITTISFDAMVMELFLPLLMGACVVLVDEEMRLDGEVLLKKARKNNITLIWGTPSIWRILLDSGWKKPLKIKALIGGEQVPRPLALELIERCNEVWNIYGPTETTVCAFLTRITKDDNPIVIGKPIANTTAYLLDKNKNPVAIGEIGEIVIGGDGVSLGYLNRPELNQERFQEDFINPVKGKKMYFSGDLGKILPNGQVQCLGRIDNQVKIRGHRIELGEIESVIGKLPGIKKTVVIASNHFGTEPKLVSYIQSIGTKDSKIIRKQLEEILPDYLIPSVFMWVDEFHITTNGKIDLNSLPKPEYIRPDSAPIYRKPRTQVEKNIEKIWREHLQIPAVGIDDNFFEMGGTSLLTQKVATSMRKSLDIKLPVTKIYQFPTVALISKYIEDQKTTKETSYRHISKSQKSSKDVAIIGMSLRFPGASTIDELWDILSNGKESTSFFKIEELDPSIPESLINDPLYVKARGVVPSAKEFDAQFFGINPKLAEAMDPQQRLFLEIAWEVLEQTGYLPKHYNGSVGVYAGTGTNTYYKNNVLPNKELINLIGNLIVDTVNEKDYIASRTAYHLNLKGPAVSIHSACSTSLVAIAEAVEAIRNGQCDVALAGGSSVTSPINSGHLYQEGSMLSSDGHCRSFDAEGKGTVFSDGAGVILLKSLEAAKKDGDFIYGIIKGVGLNNDGGGKGSFTAPSVEGQADAISKALLDAQVSPSEISYVEAHGTATPLGDPIEVEGLNTAFGAQKTKNYCGIGSIKSNMGHLTAAAGVAGLIKTILAMQHKQIPASIGFEKPNPAIDFENSPFYVNTKLRDWNINKGTRLAGVSSFGVGGTNAHVILEEYPMELPEFSETKRPLQILTWSAKTGHSLDTYEKKMGNYLIENSSVELANVAFSLKTTRDSFNHRKFIIAKNTFEASDILLSESTKKANTKILNAIPNEVIFLFPGQGAQFLHMGRALYDHEMVFKEAFDNCNNILKTQLNLDIKDIIFPEIDSVEAELKLKDTRYTQPALFVTEYALAKLWMSWGIYPTAFCGHSIGEFVGAHLAGIFNLEDALLLIAKRGKMVSELPQGSMLSIRLSEDTLKEILPSNLCIAAVNSDSLCVVSGPDAKIEDFVKSIKQQNKEIPHRLLATSHAFHSTMMNPILETFKQEVEKTTLNAPKTPIISTVTGTWLTDAEAMDADYWTNHLRATVEFSAAIDTILKLEEGILLEVGPGKALSTLASQKGAAKKMSVITSLPIPKPDEDAYPALLEALGQLWLNGMEPNWYAYYLGESRKKLKLPSYAFDRKVCWVEPVENNINKNEILSSLQTLTPLEELPEISNINKTKAMRKPFILKKISELISNSSGIEVEASEANYSFLELGLDSLVLTQIAITCKKEFKIPITFRQLNEEFSSPELLANYLDKNMPEDMFAATVAETPVLNPHQNGSVSPLAIKQNSAPLNNSQNQTALSLIAQQLQLLGKQVELMQGKSITSNTNIANLNTSVTDMVNIKPVSVTKQPEIDVLSEEEKQEHKKPFGASPKIEKQVVDLNAKQLKFLKQLTKRYNKKTAASKSYAQKHRAKMADPRVVSGFKPLTKDLVYPLVIKKSSGNRLWDLDGNEYIDALNGFGSCFFGHQPEFIKEALHMQIESGFEVGPQHPLAGEVCDLLCEFTGHDRAALCNTGSEAVLGAMRIARTVTGRSLIVAFTGSYHGINDEGLVRGSKKMMTFPAAAGIMSEAVKNMLVLDYGTEESLNIIRERANELAAVLVEPVQSRRPEFQPIEFLNELREITSKSETALIFDEVITGFRMHPGGVQTMFGIQADIATYGKVIGGGLSIGAILGKKKYLDALDGGFWQYNDTSYPEVGVTYFAGTFVRHPLVLATAKASLIFMKEKGPELQENVSEMTQELVNELNIEFNKRKLPIIINSFGSLWRLKFTEDILYSELLFVLLREKGIHIWDGFPCFLTMAYTKADIDKIVLAIKESLDEMTLGGFFLSEDATTSDEKSFKKKSSDLNKPPVPNARLGIDEEGNPAWFVPHTGDESGFVKIKL